MGLGNWILKNGPRSLGSTAKHDICYVFNSGAWDTHRGFWIYSSSADAKP